MTADRQRAKAQRRSSELRTQAWRAVEAKDLALAERLCQRAVTEAGEDFEAWIDLGEVLLLADKLAEADRAFRQALSFAPRCSEAWAGLAEIYLREDKLAKAVDHLRRAVASDRDNRVLLARLHELEARLVPRRATDVDEALWRPPPPPGPRALRIDWAGVATSLDARGCALLPELLSLGECAELAALWDDPVAAGGELRYDGPSTGCFTRRDLGQPPPSPVLALCAELYACLVPMARQRAERIERDGRWPPSYEDLVAMRERQGEPGTRAALCRVGAGGSQVPWRAPPRRDDFPFTLLVTLGTVATEGGDFVLLDLRPGRKRHETVLPLRPGDGIVFAAHDRLRAIGGVWGMQPVANGLTAVVAGERLLLDVRP